MSRRCAGPCLVVLMALAAPVAPAAAAPATLEEWIAIRKMGPVEKRREAVRAIATFLGPEDEVLAALIDAAVDENSGVRAQAIRVLRERYSRPFPQPVAALVTRSLADP